MLILVRFLVEDFFPKGKIVNAPSTGKRKSILTETRRNGSVFAKMMVNDVFTDKGLFSPEELGTEERAYCFHELAKLGVTVEEIVETRLF